MVLHGAGHYPACWLARPHPLLAAEPQRRPPRPSSGTSAVTSAEVRGSSDGGNSFGASEFSHRTAEPVATRRSHQRRRGETIGRWYRWYFRVSRAVALLDQPIVEVRNGHRDRTDLSGQFLICHWPIRRYQPTPSSNSLVPKPVM